MQLNWQGKSYEKNHTNLPSLKTFITQVLMFISSSVTLKSRIYYRKKTFCCCSFFMFLIQINFALHFDLIDTKKICSEFKLVILTTRIKVAYSFCN